MNDQLKRIVLIDDDATTNFLNKMVVEKTGLADEVITFNSAEDALQYYKQDEAQRGKSLILLDLNMPVMDGWQFLERYEAMIKGKPDPIVLLTSSINPADKRMAEDHPCIMDFKSKPLTIEILKEIANQLS